MNRLAAEQPGAPAVHAGLTPLGHWAWDVAADRVTWSDEQHRVFGRAPGTGPPTLAAFLALPLAAHAAFVTFETGQVRPLALSSDGSRLYAVNTPDNQLEIFAVGTAALTHVASVPVGLEPCAVAVRDAASR